MLKKNSYGVSLASSCPSRPCVSIRLGTQNSSINSMCPAWVGTVEFGPEVKVRHSEQSTSSPAARSQGPSIPSLLLEQSIG